MEEKLLKVFKLADKLNNKNSKIYAEIRYEANKYQKLEINIRRKKWKNQKLSKISNRFAMRKKC